MDANEFDFNMVENMVFAVLLHFRFALVRKTHSIVFFHRILGIISTSMLEYDKVIAIHYLPFAQSEENFDLNISYVTSACEALHMLHLIHAICRMIHAICRMICDVS